jgi:hypothetical protein
VFDQMSACIGPLASEPSYVHLRPRILLFLLLKVNEILLDHIFN